VTDDVWIAYRSAAVMLGGDARVLDALMGGKIKSRGLNNLLGEEEDILADRWGQWTFLPTFRGPVPEWMRAAGWLVPPGTEVKRICCGFKEIRLLRADVAQLAAPPAIEPEPQDTEQSPPRPPKLRMDQHLAAKLLELFPHGPPPNMRVSEMCARIREARDKGLGSFTERSLIRARALAWPQLKKVSRD
jgi:hypothetical protein